MKKSTLPFQSTETLADAHAHVCEYCNTSFTHSKSLIAPGQGHYAHVCPNPQCRKPVNNRVELSAFDGKPLIRPDYLEWYGIEALGRNPYASKPPRKRGR